MKVLVGANANTTMPAYKTLSWQHKIAENIPGAQLEKNDARTQAEKILTAHGINLADIYEVSAVPKQLPERIDWTFTFAHKLGEPIKEGEARIVVTLAGDQLAHYYQKVHLPETWKRQEQKEHAATNALQTLCNLLIRILCLLGMCIALLFWAYKKIPGRVFAASFALFILLFTVKLVDNWPQLLAQLNTTEPYANQVFKTYAMLMLQFLLQAIVFSGLLSLMLQAKQRYTYASLKTSLAVGTVSGLVLAAAWTALAYFKPSIAPLWGYYNTLGTAFPYLGFINTHVLKYLQYTAVFAFGSLILNYITDCGKKFLACAVALCIIGGLTFAGFESIELISFWLISGTVFGALIFLLWYYLLRFSVETVPVTLAICFSLAILQQMFFNVLPGIIGTGIICIACIIALARFLSDHIRKLHA